MNLFKRLFDGTPIPTGGVATSPSLICRSAADMCGSSLMEHARTGASIKDLEAGAEVMSTLNGVIRRRRGVQ